MEPADKEFNEDPQAATSLMVTGPSPWPQPTPAVAETGVAAAPPKPAEPLSPQQHHQPPAAGKPKSSAGPIYTYEIMGFAPSQAAEAQAAEAQEAPPSQAITLDMRGEGETEEADATEAQPDPPHEVGEFFNEIVLPTLAAVED